MNDITRFLKRLRGLTLSNNERLAMRERLIAYADLHPAVAPVSGIRSPYVHFFTFIASRRFSTYALMLVLLVTGGAGLSLASESSVPGDSLYALKINVNEPIMSALATSPTDQAKVAADIATRRVDEAVTLANRGELTPDRQAYLSAQFTERVKIATQKTDQLATLDSSAADSVKADLAANLAGEAQALGAAKTAKKTDDAAFFRTVIATSQSIANEEDGAYATATSSASVASIAVATSTDEGKGAAVHIDNVRLTAAKANATTTPARGFVPRFGAALRLTATTTFSTASTTLSVPAFVLPKTDVAIPPSSDASSVNDTPAHPEE